MLKQLTERGTHNRPRTLSRNEDKSTPTRVEMFARVKATTSLTNSGVIEVPVPAYWNTDDDDASLQKAVTTFRMRWLMSCRCVARILIAGKKSDYSGRMPGILEETMLALRLSQPLYVIGGFGGGAQVVGELLGLACDWPDDNRALGTFGSISKDKKQVDRAVRAEPEVFRPAGFSELPLTVADAMAFITGYSIGGPSWPENGLTLDENRLLFRSTNLDEIVRLVLNGLKRRFPG